MLYLEGKFRTLFLTLIFYYTTEAIIKKGNSKYRITNLPMKNHSGRKASGSYNLQFTNISKQLFTKFQIIMVSAHLELFILHLRKNE